MADSTNDIQTTLKARDVARLLDLSKASVYALAKEGKLSHYKFPLPGGKVAVRFELSDVIRFKNRCYVKCP